MMTIVLRKSTVRPCASVSRPSSSSCSSTLSTSGCAFSTSSNSTTEYGRRRTASVSWPGLVVADVAWRRADQPRDRVLLLVLAHVDAHHRLLVVEQELGQRARRLRLADAGRAQEQERAERPIRVLQSGARGAHRVGHGLDRLVLADDALAQPILHLQQLFDLALEHLADRHAGPLADDFGDVLLGDFLLDQRAAVLAALALRALRRRPAAARARGSRTAAAPRAPSPPAATPARARARFASSCSCIWPTEFSWSSSACHCASRAPACSFSDWPAPARCAPAARARPRPSPCAAPRARSRAA